MELKKIEFPGCRIHFIAHHHHGVWHADFFTEDHTFVRSYEWPGDESESKALEIFEGYARALDRDLPK